MINNYDVTLNHYTGVVNFNDPDDFMRTTFNVRSDDRFQNLVNTLTFPYGLRIDEFEYYGRFNIPMRFTGVINFLGIQATGQIDTSVNDNNAAVTLVMPTWQIGGGNVQFFTFDDLMYTYDVNPRDFRSRSLDMRIDPADLVRNNTITSYWNANGLAASRLTLDSNAVLFDMVIRVNQVLDDRVDQFSFAARPFNGAFEAVTNITVNPIDDFEIENTSTMNMAIIDSSNRQNLQNDVNTLFDRWVTRIIRIGLEMDSLRQQYSSQIETNNLLRTPIEECGVTQQCQDLPRIICDEFAQQAVCIEEIEVCEEMVQQCTDQSNECTRTDPDGNCVQSINVCNQWENVCRDGETTNVCVQFNDTNIPDRCLQMELTCTKFNGADERCVAESRRLSQINDDLTANIDLIDEFQTLIRPLRNSAICLIRRISENNSDLDCESRDDDLEGIPDVIDLLDIAEIRSMTAEMELRDAVSADDIIFDTLVVLYGDWSNPQIQPGERTIIRNDLQIEEEDPSTGRNLGSESLINVNHITYFESYNRTSNEIYDGLRMIICREYGINEEESMRMQVIIREFGLLDGNRTFCPNFDIITPREVEQVDTPNVGEPLVFNPDFYTTDEFTSTNILNADDQIGMLTYIFGPDPKVVQVSLNCEQIINLHCSILTFFTLVI